MVDAPRAETMFPSPMMGEQGTRNTGQRQRTQQEASQGDRRHTKLNTQPALSNERMEWRRNVWTYDHNNKPIGWTTRQSDGGAR